MLRQAIRAGCTEPKCVIRERECESKAHRTQGSLAGSPKVSRCSGGVGQREALAGHQGLCVHIAATALSSSLGHMRGWFICVLPCYCCPWEVSSVSIQEATQSCFGSWASTIRFFHLQRLRQGGKKTEKAKLLCRIHCCKSRVITLNIMSLHTSFPAPTWERSFASGQFLP